MKNKWFSFLLLLLLLFIFGLSAALAESTQYEEGDWRYTVLDDNSIRLDRYLGQDTVVEVPNILREMCVTEMECTFADTAVEKVILPDNVQVIGFGTFANCSELREVVVSHSYLMIEDAAFLNCVRLEQLDLSGMTHVSLHGSPFWGCKSLKALETQTIFLSGAPFLNSRIQELTVHGGVPNDSCEVEEYALTGIDLRNVSLPDDTTFHGKKAADGTLNIVPKAGLAWVKNQELPEDPANPFQVFYSCNLLLRSDMTPEEQDSWIHAHSNKSGNPQWTYVGPVDVKCKGNISERLSACKTRRIENGFDYGFLPDGTVRLNRYAGNETDVTIPETLGGQPVTVIGSGAFEPLYRPAYVTSVSIPDSVTRIEEFAFVSCSELKSVKLPVGLSYIGDAAFYGIGPTEINFPETIDSERIRDIWSTESLRSDNLYYINRIDGTIAIIGVECDEKLTELTIPEQIDGRPVTSVDYRDYEHRFSRMKSLKKITFPDSITRIGSNMFELLPALEKIVLPSGLLEVGDYAFWECRKLTLKAENIPESIRSIGAHAFSRTALSGSLRLREHCVYGSSAFSDTKITAVTMEDGVTEIPYSLFRDCSKLTKITFGAGLQKIESNAFLDTGLTALTLPGTIQYLGRNCFGTAISKIDATAIYDVTLPEEGFPFDSYSKTKTVLTVVSGSPLEIAYRQKNPYGITLKTTIPTEIYTAPADVVLKADALDSSKRIFNLVIPEGVEEIEPHTFEGLTTLITVQFPSTLKKIGDRAFKDCTALTDFKLPKNLEELGAEAFSGCTSLKSVTFPKPLSVLGSKCFSRCTGLTKLTLNNALTVIPESSFVETAIKTLAIPEGVTGIERGAFMSCNELSSVTFPKSLTSISDVAFYNCINLKKIILPAKLETIGQMAFAIDSKLLIQSMNNNVKIGLSSALTIPASVREIGEGAFMCQGIPSLNFAQKSQLETMGDEAFAICLWMTSADLSTCVDLKTLGKGAFTFAEKMKTLTLPGSIESFGREILRDTGKSLTVTVPADSPAAEWMKATYPDIKLKETKQKKQ